MRIDGGINMMYPQAVEREKRIDGDKPKGRKVRYTQAGGSQNDWRYANKFLTLGDEYVVGEIYVYSSHSDVVLENLPDVVFNSAIFEDLEPESESDDFLPPVESEKVLLKKEQVVAIDLWLSRFDDKEALVNSHSKITEDKRTDCGWNWDEEFRSLNDLSVARLAKALFIGYEIEEPTPQFEPGDLVMIESVFGFEDDKFVTLDKYYPAYKAWTFNGTGKYIPEEKLSKPTQDEIYWLHDLKRAYVYDFNIGDVIITKEMEMYKVQLDALYDEDCTMADAEKWARNGEIERIYPFESSKEYRKEEN